MARQTGSKSSKLLRHLLSCYFSSFMGLEIPTMNFLVTSVSVVNSLPLKLQCAIGLCKVISFCGFLIRQQILHLLFTLNIEA